MKTQTFFLTLCCTAFVANSALAEAPADANAQKSCGEMVSSKADMPAKMSEFAMSIASMIDAHIAYMNTVKGKESKAEIAGLKKISQEHKDLAKMMSKTAETMKAAANWPNAPHDMKAMMADAKIQETRKKMLETHKEMLALFQREVTEMEKMNMDQHATNTTKQN